MRSKESYQHYKSYMSLGEYLKQTKDKQRRGPLSLQAQGTCLSLFQCIHSTESVFRVTAQLVEPVFERATLEGFVELMTRHPSWPDGIAYQFKKEVGWASGRTGALRYTLEEVKEVDYYDSEDECNSEEEEDSKTVNATQREHIGSILTDLRQSFRLPEWQRISLDVDKKVARAEPEYPGWLITFAADMIEFEESAERAEAKARTRARHRLLIV